MKSNGVAARRKAKEKRRKRANKARNRTKKRRGLRWRLLKTAAAGRGSARRITSTTTCSRNSEALAQEVRRKPLVAIAIVLEAHEEELMQWTQQRQTWEPVASWTQSSAIADPRGGRDDAREQIWITAGPYLNLAVVGRAEIKKLEADTIAHKEGAQSRLLMMEAKFLQPIAGSSSVRLLAGHLHNTVAKKPNSADYIHF